MTGSAHAHCIACLIATATKQVRFKARGEWTAEISEHLLAMGQRPNQVVDNALCPVVTERNAVDTLSLIEFRVTALDGVLFNFENTAVIVQLNAGKAVQVQRAAHLVIAVCQCLVKTFGHLPGIGFSHVRM